VVVFSAGVFSAPLQAHKPAINIKAKKILIVFMFLKYFPKIWISGCKGK